MNPLWLGTNTLETILHTDHRMLDGCVDTLPVLGDPDLDRIVDRPFDRYEHVDKVDSRWNHVCRDWSRNRLSGRVAKLRSTLNQGIKGDRSIHTSVQPCTRCIPPSPPPIPPEDLILLVTDPLPGTFGCVGYAPFAPACRTRHVSQE